MIVNVTDDKLRTFNDLVKAVEEKYGISLHVSTLHRWRSGLRGKRLNAIRLGGRWYARLSDVLHLSDVPHDTADSTNCRSRQKKAQDALNKEFDC